MRLFIFAIGGTGARVLRSLAMLSAAGARPLDPVTGKPVAELEIVPVIIDPHRANDDLKRTEELLNSYRKLRRYIHGEASRASGFFATKISTLRSLTTDANTTLADSFIYNLSAVERKRFGEFIDFNSLDEPNQAMLRMLFSDDQMDTSMKIGFVGSPNIGSVALNSFKDSEEFQTFCNVIGADDRVFFISSIFGGTGASGFPIVLKNIRNADTLNVSNKGVLTSCRCGALTVLPYFNIEHSDSSPINKSDFIVKTRSALHYYDKSLTSDGRAALNAIYYLGDRETSSPYTNDPGEHGQKNAAHLVELVGSLAPLHFLSIPDGDLPQGHTEAFEYGLEKDTADVTLTNLGPQTRALIVRPLLKLHLLSLFLDNKFSEVIGRGFTQDTPAINRDFLSTDFYRTLSQRFLSQYWDWLEEMDSNHRHVTFFDLDNAMRLEEIVKGVEPKRGLFGSKHFTHDEIFAAINSVSKRLNGKFRSEQLPLKLMGLFDVAADNLISSKYRSITE